MNQLGVRGATEKLNVGGRMVQWRPTENDAADSIRYGMLILDATLRGAVVASMRAEPVRPAVVVCSQCHAAKSEMEFAPHPHKRNGLQSYCLACHRANMREYRAKRRRVIA